MKKIQQETNQRGIITLMYHRVDLPDSDPWGICVSPERFEKHVKVLKSNFEVIGVHELSNRLISGNIVKNAVCITFDDGYADNTRHATPVLERYDCPATFFIATGLIDQPGAWWDELEAIFLHSKYLPGQLNIEMAGKSESFLINEEELSPQQWLQHKRWRWYQPAPTSRCTIYLDIWEKLRRAEPVAMKNIMNEIKSWAGYGEGHSNFRLPMTSRELQEIAKVDLFTIGAHTHTHCDLSEASRATQRQEISLSQNVLGENFGIESHFLSYPFGMYNEDTLELANDLQLQGCFTTAAKNITAGTNKNLFGRYQAFNWNEKTFERKIRQWVTSPMQVAG